jgi:hypothetical protein
MVNRGRTIVRCFHSGSGGTISSETSFGAGGAPSAGLSARVFSGLFSGFTCPLLRIGLILGIRFGCCLVADGKVAGKVFLDGGEHGVRHAVEVAEAGANSRRKITEGVGKLAWSSESPENKPSELGWSKMRANSSRKRRT